MRPYGLPRRSCLRYPDIVDIQSYGFKSSVGKLIEKVGDYKGYIRSSKKKRAIRRVWKKKERLLSKVKFNDYLVRE